MGSGASTQQGEGRSVSPYPDAARDGPKNEVGTTGSAKDPPSFWTAFQAERAKLETQIEQRLETLFQEELEGRQKDGDDLTDQEQAELRQTLMEEDEKSHPAWDAQDALSAILAKTLSTCLVKGFLPDGGCPKNMDIAFVRALARESPASILKTLQSQQTLEKLAEEIHQEAVQMLEEEAATGADLNDKYMVATDKGFTMNFGSMVDFSKGLEQRIGSPNPNLLVSMIREHCASCDSHREWTTRNYGITTNSRQEFLLVLREVVVQLAERADDEFPLAWKEVANYLSASQAPLPPKNEWPTEWPKETKNAEHGGRQPETQQFLKELLKLNKELAKSGDKELMLEEGIMLRLYTGPLFEKYNVVPRGGSLGGCDNKFMEQLFHDLCCTKAIDEKHEWIENRYPTSIHVLSSGVVKLSALSTASTVYRGLGGNLLPKPFWTPDKYGCKGGVEYGFMSTTRDRAVATQYAGDGSVRMVLEIETGIVDRGADLRTLSQYPQEAELLFPPLTCLQVLKTKSERGVLVVKTRANVNLKGGTIDEVISKRYQVLKTMAEANTLEADQLLRSEAWPRILAGWEQDSSWVNGQLLNDFRRVLQTKMKSVMSAKATAYNEDATFLAAVRDLVQLQANCRLQSSSLLREVADEAKHERLLQLAGEREAMEVKKQSVSFSFTAGSPGTGRLWLFDVLGFEKSIDGCYYPSRDRTQYRDGDTNVMCEVATKDVVLPGTDWALLAVNGSRDLQLIARTLQSQWRRNAKVEMELELCRPTSRQDFGAALREALKQRGDVGRLTELLLSNCRCEDLDLNGASLDDEHGAQLTKALSLVGTHLSNLELLMLADNENFGSKTIAGFTEALNSGALPKMRHLRLGGCPKLFAEVGNESMRDFFLGLALCPVLEEVDLFCTGLSACASEALAEALPKCTTLRKLALQSNPQLFEANPEGIAAVCRALGILGNLEELYLSETGLASSPGACEALAEALSKNTNLRKLTLKNNPKLFEADPAGIAAVCRALSGLGDLQKLGLACTGLASSSGAGEALAEALPKCAKLRQLRLHENENLDEADKQRIRDFADARALDGRALEIFEI